MNADAHEGFIADARGRAFVVPFAHLDDHELAAEVNRLVLRARQAEEPTWFDREISTEQAAAGTRRWALIKEGPGTEITVIWNDPTSGATIERSTPGAVPVTVYEE